MWLPIPSDIEDGDEISVDFGSGTIENLTKGEKYQATPLPDFVRGIVDAGGLKEYTRKIIN